MLPSATPGNRAARHITLVLLLLLWAGLKLAIFLRVADAQPTASANIYLSSAALADTQEQAMHQHAGSCFPGMVTVWVSIISL